MTEESEQASPKRRRKPTIEQLAESAASTGKLGIAAEQAAKIATLPELSILKNAKKALGGASGLGLLTGGRAFESSLRTTDILRGLDRTVASLRSYDEIVERASARQSAIQKRPGPVVLPKIEDPTSRMGRTLTKLVEEVRSASEIARQASIDQLEIVKAQAEIAKRQEAVLTEVLGELIASRKSATLWAKALTGLTLVLVVLTGALILKPGA